jgi:hypothetical protein
VKPAIDPELMRNPLFLQLMEEGLAIQHEFSAEPVYARTGKGYLKPTGVAELEKSGAPSVRSRVDVQLM